jgi:hypothetical protein
MADDLAMMPWTISMRNLTNRHYMPTALTITGAPIRTDLKLYELPRAIAQEAPHLVVFEFQPIPGRIMGAAFDWMAVLDITADLLGIAGGLWAVYEKLIKKRKKPRAKQSPGFLIQVKNEKHTFVQFLIQEGTTKDAFIEEFTRTVSALRASESGQSAEAIIEFYEGSESHRRVSGERRNG